MGLHQKVAFTLVVLMALGTLDLPPVDAQLCFYYLSSIRSQSVSVYTYYTYRVYYSWRCGWWGWRRCTGSYLVYVYYTYYYTSYHVYYIQKHYCCYGYSGANCDPICNNNCYRCSSCLSPWNCACYSGWTGSNCCSDYNECGYNNGGCEQNCHNTVGSYYCSCYSGYTKSGSHCYDINECSSNNGGCSHDCHNTNGGYYCSCQSGYYLSSGKYCYDTNECNSNNGGCQQNCINQPGTYHCTCNVGFDLAGDKHSCSDHNECTNGVANCNHHCVNTPGGYYCYCNNGYELDIDDETCIDTNECNNNNGGCAQNCFNTIGSYYCTCDSGYNLHSDDHACVDIDECALNTDGCDHFCYNNIGGYTCDCKVGYSLHDDDHSCHDINECNTDNGGCEHTCVNEIGTYHCECNIGWLLDDNAHTCSDHDECATNVHDCDTLAPATCHNLQGSFFCTCPIGFRLNDDGRTCDDINECDENTSGCSQICNNIYGSYFCTCHTGFSLDPDQHGCSDIDECLDNPCENTCHNLVGSYYCSCNTGYQLASDQHTCVGIPCDPQLEAPTDGGISCTGDQITGETCQFTCRPGFELMGSASRTCQSNSLWTGVDTYCQHLYCPNLQEPTNGYISTVPCTSYFESTCEVKCVDGYYINGPSPHIETCAVNTNNELYWYPQYTCQYIPPCQAQPCQHGGTCQEVTMTSYYCDCGDSLFTGLNCETGIISIGDLPVINIGDTISIPISGTPDSSVSIAVTVSSPNVKLNQSTFTFDPSNPSSTLDITVSEPGVYSLSYELSGEDADNYETPATSILIVVDPDYQHVDNDYFLKNNVPVGTLVEGCCSPGVQYQCPGGVVNTVSFSSTCAWDNLDTDEFSTPGVVFAKGDGINIPISLTGAHMMMTEENYDGFTLPDQSQECRMCDNTDPTCNYFDFKPNDYIDLLETRALETTYLKAIDSLLPDWLTVTIDQLEVTGQTVFGVDDFTSYLTTGENIYEIPGCESLDLEPDSLFVVLSQDNNITAEVDGTSMKYVPGGDDPVCFAMNLCKGSSSPIHITVPTQANDYITSFDTVKGYISNGWSITFKEFLLSSNDLTFMDDGHTSLAPWYWVGSDDLVDSSEVVPDFELRTYVDMERTFCQPGGIYPCVAAAFSGDVYYQSSPQGDDVQGLLSGDLTMSLNMTVNGKTGYMSLFTTSTAALFTMPGQGSTTSAVRSGITMHSTYNKDMMDKVFNDILPIPDGQDSCPVEVFVSFTAEEEIDYIRMRSDCLNIRVGGYLYDGDFTHDIYIAGKSMPTTPSEVPDDTVLAVFSYLNVDEIQMTDSYSIQRPASGEAAIVSTHGANADSSKVTIPQAHLSILGTTFTTSLTTGPDGIMFSTDGMVALYGGFETTLSGTIPLGSSWDDFVIDIQGTFADDQGSFQNEVQDYVYEFADSFVKDSENRIEATEIASADANYADAEVTSILNNKQDAINELKADKDQAMNTYNEANQTYNNALAAFNTAYSSASQEAMQAIGLLKNVCMARETNWTCDEYLPSTNCRLMSMSMEVLEWGLKKRTHSENRLVHSVRDVTKLKWGIENYCQLITLIKGWGRTVTSQRCSYIATYDNITETMLDAYYDIVDVMRTEASVTETGTFTYNKKQYLINAWAETVSASVCQYSDAACDIGRNVMLEALQNDGNTDVVTAFINLETAKRAKTAAETTMKATKIAYNVAVDELASLQVCMKYTDPNLASNVQTIVQEEGAIQALKTTLQTTDIQDLFSINSIDFDSGYTDSASLPIMINYNILGNARVLKTTIELTATSELINRAIADAILADIGNYLEGSRKRRQATVENSFNEDQFQTRCGQLNGIKLYLDMIYDSLQSTQDTYMTAMANITQSIAMVDELLNSVPTEYPTIDFQYLKDTYNFEISVEDLNTQVGNAVPITNRTAALMHLKKTLMARMNDLSNYYYRCWQNDLKKLHSQGFIDTVGHIRCYGVVDCLNLVHEVIKTIVSDMPDSTVKTDLLSSLPDARRWLIEMSLYNSTLTMETALATNTTGMIALIQTIMDQQYWCTDIPKITTHPQSEISVQVGDTLTVKCMADSVLPITYSFERNGFLVATGLTSGEFTIVASEYDSGLYQCFASNAVGTVQSMLANVIVYVAPKIILSPSRYETFEGDDNGGFFACNATGYPEPMYEWEYSNNGGASWTTVKDSKRNELIIPKPSAQEEGWYRCKVQTEGSGVIRSEAAHLSVLNVTFSKLSYQVSFRMNSTELDLTPGSGDEPAPTPPTETVTLNYFRDQLNLTYTTVDDLHVEFSVDNTEIVVHITMSVSMNYTPSWPFDEQADMAYMKRQDLMQGLTNLQEHVKAGTFWFESEGTYYKAAHLSANVRDPIYTCPSNYILAYSNFLCVTCSPGTFYSMVNSRGACTACPLTTYSSMDGQTECIRCPSQTDTLGTGSMWLTDCIDYCKHNYYSDTGLEECTRCPNNTYAYTFRATSCTNCTGDDVGVKPECAYLPGSYSGDDDNGASTLTTIIVPSVIGSLAALLILVILIVVGIVMAMKRRKDGSFDSSMNQTFGGRSNPLYAAPQDVMSLVPENEKSQYKVEQKGGVSQGESADVVNPLYDTQEEQGEGTYDDAENEKMDLSTKYEDEVHNPYEKLDEYQSRMVQ